MLIKVVQVNVKHTCLSQNFLVI